MENLGASFSATSGPDELRLPISYQPIQYEDLPYLSGNGPKLYPPSPALLAPISEEIEDESEGIGAGENTDHTTTIPEPDICRICADPDDEEKVDDVLVKLGCHCKGQMSRMHRKCILEWYSVRMILEKNYKCELCNALLNARIQHIVFHAVADRQYGGRDIVIKAVKSVLALYAPDIDVESAATYQELVHLLILERMYPLRRLHMVVQTADGDASDDEVQPRTRRGRNRVAYLLFFVAIVVGTGLYTYFLHHKYRNMTFH